jgi:hypothetical protein
MCEVFFLGTARRIESQISDSIEETPRWDVLCDGKVAVRRPELGEWPIHRRMLDRFTVVVSFAEKRSRRDNAAEVGRARSIILQLGNLGESAQVATVELAN